MFTGLVESTARVSAVADEGAGRRIMVEINPADLALGESIAINGVCLTVAEKVQGGVRFDVVAETLAKTNLRHLTVDEIVHVERALQVGSRIGGHFVQGHVDGVAELISRTDSPGAFRLRIKTPPALADFLSRQGSITVDGVSLTLAALGEDYFDVALIPATLAATCLGNQEPGYLFNIECDLIAKTVVKFCRHYLNNNADAT